MEGRSNIVVTSWAQRLSYFLPLLYMFEKGWWCVRRLSYKIFRGKEKCVVITTMDSGGLISMCYLHIWPFDCTSSLYLFFSCHICLERTLTRLSVSRLGGDCVVWDDEDTGGPGQVVWLGGAHHAGLWLMLLPGMSVSGNCGKNNIRILQSLEMEYMEQRLV